MKKDAVDEKADKAGEPAGTEEVFKSDASMLEYLNSLLSSVPAVILESGEKRFVRLSIDEGWKGLDAAGTLLNNAISYQNELSKKEVELLELENKNLKFREELASIDAQVLRSENDNLKQQIAWLTEKLDTVMADLEKVITENDVLKQRAGSLEEQLAGFKHSAVDPSDVAAPLEAAETGVETVHDPDQQSDSGTALIEPAASGNGKVGQEGFVDCTAPAGEADILEQSGDAIEQLQVSAFRTVPVNTLPDAVSLRETVVLSRSRDLSGAAIWSTKPSSKIIKQQDTESVIPVSGHGSDHPPESPPPGYCEQYEDARMPEAMSDEEPERAFDVGSGDRALHPQNTSETDLEPLPETANDIRRNVKSYENLQNEAELPEKRTKHRLIL